ncbi:hypothetical protein JKP88DRAFT_248771 [Tribonema minus]|uniref:Uncharacterized protein n=1 Tax=Tribonema minus TaxID=303371 RepID=A0A835YVV1_9STRA|nr:hypothetical protein JKP88DRAFT_248771 [Tribonema minus]
MAWPSGASGFGLATETPRSMEHTSVHGVAVPVGTGNDTRPTYGYHDVIPLAPSRSITGSYSQTAWERGGEMQQLLLVGSESELQRQLHADISHIIGFELNAQAVLQQCEMDAHCWQRREQDAVQRALDAQQAELLAEQACIRAEWRALEHARARSRAGRDVNSGAAPSQGGAHSGGGGSGRSDGGGGCGGGGSSGSSDGGGGSGGGGTGDRAAAAAATTMAVVAQPAAPLSVITNFLKHCSFRASFGRQCSPSSETAATVSDYGLPYAMLTILAASASGSTLQDTPFCSGASIRHTYGGCASESGCDGTGAAGTRGHRAHCGARCCCDGAIERHACSSSTTTTEHCHSSGACGIRF